jgi:hypothetical protein
MVHKSSQRTFISLHKEKDWAHKSGKGFLYREMEKRDALKGDKLGGGWKEWFPSRYIAHVGTKEERIKANFQSIQVSCC